MPLTQTQIALLCEKVVVLKQKFLFGKNTTESNEFLNAFNSMLVVKGRVQSVKSGAESWAKASKLMSKSAENVAKATKDFSKDSQLNVDSLVAEMKTMASDTKTVTSLSKKNKLLNDLIKQRKLLEHYRHVRERAKRKKVLYEAKEAPSKFEDKIEYWNLKLEQATAKYNGLNTQLLEALKVVVEQNEEFGACKIVAPELKEMRNSQQFQLDAFQQIIANNLNEKVVPQQGEKLDQEWDKLVKRISVRMDEAASPTGKTTEKLSETIPSLQAVNDESGASKDIVAHVGIVDISRESVDSRKHDFDDANSVHSNGVESQYETEIVARIESAPSIIKEDPVNEPQSDVEDDAATVSSSVLTRSKSSMMIDVPTASHTNALAMAIANAERKMSLKRSQSKATM